MKNLFFVALILFPVLSHSQDVEQYLNVLNSDSHFDELKKAAAGNKFAARQVMKEFVSQYCDQTKKCSRYSDSDPELKGEIAVELAKIQLKTVEEANRKYAETLIAFNKQLSECQEKPTTLFSQEFKESCTEEIICKGSKAQDLMDLFKKYGAFEDKVGTAYRELGPEEKMVGGEDISFMLNKPITGGRNIDAVESKFSMAPLLHNHVYTNIEKKLFTTKIEKTNYKAVKFDKNYLPEGIMALRALLCEDGMVRVGDKVKDAEFGCHVYVGNRKVDLDQPARLPSCLVKEPEDTGFFSSFTNLFSKKKDVVEVNDTDRNKVKEADVQAPVADQKGNKAAER